MTGGRLTRLAGWLAALPARIRGWARPARIPATAAGMRLEAAPVLTVQRTRDGWLVRVALPWESRELAARAAIGMPAGHPEQITARLPLRQELWLASAATRLWAHGEYAQIIRDTRPEAGL